MATSQSTIADQDSNQTASRIVIVGGGTSGWMTAAMLSHAVTASECCITIIDNGDGGIGVGEATIPSILQLIKSVGGDEADFMRSCDATWKLGIQFCDWKTKGHTAWHPFGQCGAKIDERDLFSYWLTDQSRPYQSHSLNWNAAIAGKSPHSSTGQSAIAASGAYAFHLNASRLANWLKQKAIDDGTITESGRVQTVETDDSGQVLSIQLEDGTQIKGDLFVDCTGFDSVLISQCREDAWVDCSDRLLCDAAVTMRLPETKIKQPFTTATALSSGWTWDIPLMNGRGVGYVFSSQFVSDRDATEELKQHVQSDEGMAETDVHSLKMKVGRRRSAWLQNVVAIGLSAGFVEPLESSGLHLIQTAVERLLKYFPLTNDGLRSHRTSLSKAFNQETAVQFDQILDFVQLHYLVNQRDEPFWKAARDARQSNELRHRLNLYDEIGMLDQLQPSAFPDASYYYLLAGNQRLPKRAPAISLSVDQQRLQFVMKAILDQNRNALRSLPLHEEMLQHVHANPIAKAS